jgi:hypothetical protein
VLVFVVVTSKIVMVVVSIHCGLIFSYFHLDKGLVPCLQQIIIVVKGIHFGFFIKDIIRYYIFTKPIIGVYNIDFSVFLKRNTKFLIKCRMPVLVMISGIVNNYYFFNLKNFLSKKCQIISKDQIKAETLSPCSN